jgi:hypothetical protein
MVLKSNDRTMIIVNDKIGNVNKEVRACMCMCMYMYDCHYYYHPVVSPGILYKSSILAKKMNVTFNFVLLNCLVSF